MADERRLTGKPGFWPAVIGSLLGLVFLVLFWGELVLLVRFLGALVRLITTGRVVAVDPGTPVALLMLILAGGLYLVVSLGLLRWLAVFVLPGRGRREQGKVFSQLVDFSLGLHGPAVFVRNGELVSRKDEAVEIEKKKHATPALALIDLNSAVTVERRVIHSILNDLFRKKSDPKAPGLHVLGPGLGFLDDGERIRGVVDLRPQKREIKDVQGFTSDGIGLHTRVTTTFTLGQPPEVVTVASAGPGAEGLRRVQMDPQGETIAALVDYLDPDYRRLLFDTLRRNRPRLSAPFVLERGGGERPPYPIDEDRIIAAVLSQPRNVRDGKLEKWSDLPPQVAVSILLDKLSRISYNQLYSLDGPVDEFYLYYRFKPEFTRLVKSQGVLDYQVVERLDRRPAAVGDRLSEKVYLAWPVQPGPASKPLRDRGVKVLEAGFSELKPLDASVTEQLYETWRTQWQSRVERTNADYDLEVMRVRNHERAAAQREIIYNLSQIFKLPGNTQEAIALRIFQALEAAASNPATRRLLPHDTVEILQNLQRLLYPSGRESGSGTPSIPGGQNLPPTP